MRLKRRMREINRLELDLASLQLLDAQPEFRTIPPRLRQELRHAPIHIGDEDLLRPFSRQENVRERGLRRRRHRHREEILRGIGKAGLASGIRAWPHHALRGLEGERARHRPRVRPLRTERKMNRHISTGIRSDRHRRRTRHQRRTHEKQASKEEWSFHAQAIPIPTGEDDKKSAA